MLESLALIGSEIGEVADECLGAIPTAPKAAFGEALADIVLRTADLAHCQGVNLAEVVSQANGLKSRSRGLTEDIAEVMVDFAKWVNTARADSLFPGPPTQFAEQVEGIGLTHVEQALDRKRPGFC